MHGMVGDDESASGRPVGQAGQSAGLAPELPSELAARKAELRLRVLGARRRLSPAERALAGRQLRDAILEDPQAQMAGVVAAYVSVGSEPDTRALIFALWKRGTYVLLPLLRPDQDLDWASYEGPDSLVEGPRGLVEPTEPPRGVEAITSADLVLVPAPGGRPRGQPARPGRRVLRPGPGQGRPRRAHHRAAVRGRADGRHPGRAARSAGPGRRPARRRNHQAAPSRCYHLAVERGEC